MIILFGFILLLACLIVGVRHGGLGLAAVSGIGLAIYVFVIGLVPGKPPIDCDANDYGSSNMFWFLTSFQRFGCYACIRRKISP